MKQIEVGRYALSVAGRDCGKYYVIFLIEAEYVYLVDGKIRITTYPKKKNIKHIRVIDHKNQVLADKIINKTIKNEEIKRAIKLLNNEDL